MKSKTFEVLIGGEKITAEFTDLADQTNGSVLLKQGDTVVLATVVMSHKEKESSYFPLSVEFDERFYAAGKILGSKFIRRENRPSEEAILSGRVIDRTIRPLFEQSMRYEVQVVVMALAVGEHDPDILGINAVSLALAVSDIPWRGPVSAVRVFKEKDMEDLIINPTYKQRESLDKEFDMIICGKDTNIVMIEVGADESSETVLAEAFKKASGEIEIFNEFQKRVVAEIGKVKKEVGARVVPEEITSLFTAEWQEKLKIAIFSGVGKEHILAAEEAWLKEVKENLGDAFNKESAGHFIEERVNELLHLGAINEDKRADGRGMSELRTLYAKAGGISSTLHGSGIFYRGGTHVLGALTLGGPQDALSVSGMEGDYERRFILHYNFPPFSAGETGKLGGVNRRMVGHGALAEKALSVVIPNKEVFPYTIRIVAESLASNGSTSMASVCAGTLALMDAGVPIKRPVAGIAMGLLMEEGVVNPKYKILTDIQGPEDHHGDMDFKVAGTKNGVNAIQMDIKTDGVPISILAEAMEQARVARLQILETIEGEISVPRADISPNAPKILITKIKIDQIGMVIGTGGKVINDIKAKTGADIMIEDDGTVYITGKHGSAEKALKIVEEMTHEFKVGERFEGVVTKIAEFGAFVRLIGNTEGLVHISELAPFRVEKIGDLLKEGQVVPVIVKAVEIERNRIALSIKDCEPNFFKEQSK